MSMLMIQEKKAWNSSEYMSAFLTCLRVKLGNPQAQHDKIYIMPVVGTWHNT